MNLEQEPRARREAGTLVLVGIVVSAGLFLAVMTFAAQQGWP